MANVTAVSSALFSFTKDKNLFSSELSTVQGKNNGSIFSRIYDDSCDIGFVMVSLRTKRRVVFSFGSTDYQDGEAVAFNFESEPVNGVIYRAVVFND